MIFGLSTQTKAQNIDWTNEDPVRASNLRPAASAHNQLLLGNPARRASNSSCEQLDPETERDLKQAAQAPFEIFYVGHEVVGRDQFDLQKLAKLPYGLHGAQPFFNFSKGSQFECISGDYDSAAPFIKLLAQAFLKQQKITAIKFAGMRPDHTLVIEA